MLPSEEHVSVRTVQVVFHSANAAASGWIEVNPAFLEDIEALGLVSADQILNLSGEVVSGHPDRHVVRVKLPRYSQAFYLKRQHSVVWREKLRNWNAGFGWVSRSEREGNILKQLVAVGLACPRWVAVGVDGRGRAFLLVEEQAGSVDLRQLLNETALSQAERVSFAKRLGKWLAEYHNLGFTTPELAAKHVLINRAERKFTLIDWQSALRVPFVSLEDRLRALAALHASLAEPLASTRERLRVLWEALRTYREEGLIEERFSEIVRRVVREANRLLKRRSIRDQRQSTPPVSQRLIWVAGEAVCAVPDVASTWPTPAIASPFYGCEPGRETVQLPDGCDAILIRGRSFSPLGRLRAWFRGKSWRSQGVTLGRLLFHLERYGIAAPRLLAFGQRFTGRTTAEWFALHTLPAEAITVLPDSAIALQLGRMLRQLHDAGCSVGDKPLTIFGLDCSVVCIRDPMAVRIAKPNAERELRSFLAALPHGVRKHAKLGYRTEQQPIRQDKTTRATKTVNRLPLADVT